MAGLILSDYSCAPLQIYYIVLYPLEPPIYWSLPFFQLSCWMPAFLVVCLLQLHVHRTCLVMLFVVLFMKTLHVNPLGFHVWSLSSHQGHPKYQHDDCLLSRPDAYQERPLGRAWNRCNSIRRCLTYSCILPAAEPFLDGSETAGRDVYSLQVYLKGKTVIQTSP